jgi:3-dehydroquinate synthase
MAGTPVMVSGGERVKSDGFATIGKIAKAVFEARLAPSDVLVAIGGGTVIDAAGFAAASVRGGVKFVIVPTTIAAAMDSTFMESARIDAMDVKDAIRIRMRPSAALIDVGFSSTVLDGVWRGGLGALTRYAAASDAGLMKRIVAAKEELKARDMEMLSSLLKEAVASCASNGSPNTGLWAAHRLESMSNFKLPHGYAVPMGVCMDCAYGVKAGILSETDAQTIRSTLEFFGAFEGFMHSHHILGRVQSILRGIDTWWLSGDGALDIPRSIGKTVKVEFPDREIYAAVLEELVADVMNRSQGQEKTSPVNSALVSGHLL